ncbi:MAG: hypothetical protein ACFCUW_03820 [Kiloniellaceae bacterium]
MIQAEPPSGAVAPLPLLPTVSEAYRLVFGNLATMAKVTVLPFVLLFLITVLGTLLGPLEYRLVREFGAELPWTLMAVAWLRFLLLGPTSGDVVVFPRLRARHGRFLGYALLLSVINLPLTFFHYLSVALGIDGTEATIAYWALFMPLLYLGLRFAFVYVAAAVDEPYSFAHAWRHTRGISFTLFIAIGLSVVLPAEGINRLLALLTDSLRDSDSGTFVALLLWHANMWLVEALSLAFYVIAFRNCTGWVPAPDKEVLERFD